MRRRLSHELHLHGHRVRWRTGVMLAATLAAAASARAQEASPLSTDVVLADFGLDRVGDVVRGRLSVVAAPEGARLEVHYLTDAPPPPAREPDALPAPPLLRPPTTAAAPAGPSAEAPLSSLWVWNTVEIVADAAERAAFLDLVEEEGIDRIFLQLVPGEGLVPSGGFVPFDGTVLGPLVAELRARGALTYALDGDPEYTRPESHEGVVRTVARVAAHNRSSPPEQRFHGVRYDVEPYLLRGFQGPRRGGLLADYLRLLEAVADAASAGDLAFGADIPFWLDLVDEVTGMPFEADLEGRRSLVLPRVLELVDDVAVMAYRTGATGPDGVATHVADELARAADRGVEVFVGIETTPIAGEELYTIRGPGRSGLPPQGDAAWVVLQTLGEERVRIWLVDEDDAREALRRSVVDPATLTFWFAGSPVRLPGDRISFHSLGPEAMRQMEGELLRELAGIAAFRGLAYHDYVGLSSLLGR